MTLNCRSACCSPQHQRNCQEKCLFGCVRRIVEKLRYVAAQPACVFDMLRVGLANRCGDIAGYCAGIVCCDSGGRKTRSPFGFFHRPAVSLIDVRVITLAEAGIERLDALGEWWMGCQYRGQIGTTAGKKHVTDFFGVDASVYRNAGNIRQSSLAHWRYRQSVA